MICDQNGGENYCGLDSDRDTVAEVETALRFFPEVLSQKNPLQCLSIIRVDGKSMLNAKAVPFFLLFVQLSIEFGSFEDDERGGLLIRPLRGHFRPNTLQSFVGSDPKHGREHNRHFDDIFSSELKKLGRMGVLVKEDIIENNLVAFSCCRTYNFGENQFRFLVDWDPTSLIQIFYLDDTNTCSPLHLVSYNCDSIVPFRTVFKYGINYYPTTKGISLLFRKDNTDDTLIHLICKIFEREKVMGIIEETLAQYSNTSVTQLNTKNALVLAAIDDNVHLDGFYFLFRREPGLFIQILSESTNSNRKVVDAACVYHDDDDYRTCNDNRKRKRNA